MTEHLRERPGDQPLPTPNDHLDIQAQVIADIQARREVGIQRYGTALQPHNGRDALRDLYEELLDGAMYVKQAMVEREENLDPATVEVRWADLDLVMNARRPASWETYVDACQRIRDALTAREVGEDRG